MQRNLFFTQLYLYLRLLAFIVKLDFVFLITRIKNIAMILSAMLLLCWYSFAMKKTKNAENLSIQSKLNKK
ncbi:hypothetical protein Riv7116_4660 [Rivularia sp. PCC 7116]|nr:hypothetical protein Riv7116_4660 [Rivularia sp. PCC 7116]